MRKSILFMMVAIAIPAAAQFHKGAIELSFSGYGGVNKQEIEVEDTQYSEFNEELDANKYFVLFIRADYFLCHTLSIEPEISWTTQDKMPPSYFLSANAAYHFTQINKRVVPFVLAGMGVGNGLPVMNLLPAGYPSNKFDVTLFTVGAGVKYPLSEKIALRLEYRYQRYKMDYHLGLYENDVYHRIPAKSILSENNLLIGFSVFVK